MSAIIDMTTAVFNLLKSKTSYEYKFDDYPSNLPPPSPWNTSVSGYGYAHVVDTPHYGAAGKSLKLNSTNGAVISYVDLIMGSTEGILDTELLAGGSIAGVYGRKLALSDGAVPALEVAYHNDGHIYLHYLPGWIDLGAYTLDAWNHLMVFWNDATTSFYISLDGTRWPYAGSYGYIAGAVSINRLYLQHTGTTTNYVCLDTATIYGYSAGWSENFDAYGVGAPPPPPWTNVTGGGATVLVSNAWSDSAPNSVDITGAVAGAAYTSHPLFWPAPNDWMKVKLVASPATDTLGNQGRRIDFIRAAGGIGGSVYFHSDAHIYALDGITPRDIGGYVAGLTYNFTFFFDKVNRVYYIEHRGHIYGPYSYVSAVDIDTVNIANNSLRANKLYVDTIDVTFLDPVFTDNFDTDTSDQDPPAPWTNTYIPESWVKVVDTPHQGTAGKSLELKSGDATTHAYAWVDHAMSGAVTYFVYMRAADSIAGAYGRRVELYNSAGGGTVVLTVAMHSDGHIWASDGAAWRDLGTYALDTWYLLKLVTDTVAKKYYLELEGVRFPVTPGLYDFTAALVPDRVRSCVDGAANRFYIDVLRFGVLMNLPALQFLTEYPRVSPTGPMAVLKMVTDDRKWGFTGSNSGGKKCIVHRLTFKFIVLVPAFVTAEDAFSGIAEVELIDTLLDVYAGLLMTNRHSLINFSNFMCGSISEVGFDDTLHYLYRSLNLTWRYYEEVI